jgi:putative protease
MTVLLTSDLSAHDGISIGDIGKEMNSTEDPRIGFTVKKMYTGHQICSKAGSGETIEIPLPPQSAGERSSFPFVGDSVYKTFDFELQRDILKTFPTAGSSDEEREAFIEQTVLNAYNNSDAVSRPGSTAASPSPVPSSPSYSSSDVFPISEMVEKLSPAESLQIPVSFECQIEAGFPVVITVFDLCGRRVTVSSDYIVEPSQKNPFSEAQGKDILLKLGSTIYQTLSADISVIGECFVPVGEFKNIRNKALQALLNERIAGKRRPSPEAANPKNSGFAGETQNLDRNPDFPAQISVCVYSESGLFAALEAGADRVYIGGDLFKDPLTQAEYGISADMMRGFSDKLSASDLKKIFFRTPFITKEEDFEILNSVLKSLKEIGISGISASNVGVYEFVRSNPDFSASFKIALDSAFNIFNSDAAHLFFKEGVSSVLLSPELSLPEIKKLIQSAVLKGGAPAFECTVHGRQRLMVTEHPLLQSLLKNEKKNEKRNKPVSLFEYVLKDSKNYMFPVLADTAGRNHIFNSRELNAFDLLNQIRDADIMFFRIDGIGHTSDEIFSLVKHYKNGLADSKIASDQKGASKSNSGSNDGSEFTKGNFLRSVE